MRLKANSLNERQLIEGCRKRNPTYQKGLFDLYAGKMLSVCRRYARHEMEAEDMLQDGFIKVFRFIDSYSGKGSFEGWIRRIMVNTALKYCNKSSFKKEFIGVETRPENAVDPVIYSKLEADDLHKLISSLPNGYRIVFNLYVVEGYSHKEIAELLEIEASTSRSQLVKARRILRKKIIEHGNIAI